LEHAADRVIDRAGRDRRRAIELAADGWPKWFRHDVAVDLSRLLLASPQSAFATALETS
jgi:hypothetical protein